MTRYDALRKPALNRTENTFVDSLCLLLSSTYQGLLDHASYEACLFRTIAAGENSSI